MIHSKSFHFEIVSEHHIEHILKKKNKIFKFYQQGDWVGFIHQIALTGSATTWFFEFCEFGNDVTSHFADVNDALYDASIALLNLGMAKHQPFIMNNAQNPVKMRSLMNIECTRELFKKV